MKLVALILSALAVTMTGCGSLKVKVDVLDPQYVRGELADEALRKAYLQINTAQPGELADLVDRNYRAYQREVLELAKRHQELARKFPPDGQKALDKIAEDIKFGVSGPTLVNDVARHGALAEDLAQSIRELGSKMAWNGRGPVPKALREQLLNFESETKRFKVIQQRELRELSADARRIAVSAAAQRNSAGVATAPPTPEVAAATRAIAAQEAVVQAAAQRSIIQGAELTHTEYAYVVASAPDNLWSLKYNEAYGSGTFGNVDVVIRMNSTADFSVKGMRFDASTVAQVASKVMTQSLLLGAQMAGVPVSTASTGSSTGGDALSKSSSDLAAMDQTIAKREALSEAQRSAIRTAARSILSVTPQLESGNLSKTPNTDDERKALHSAVQTTLDALKPQLSLQDLQ